MSRDPFESGPFCSHWGEYAYNCQEKCKNCNHTCEDHFHDWENDDSCKKVIGRILIFNKTCKCKKFIEKDKIVENEKMYKNKPSYPIRYQTSKPLYNFKEGEVCINELLSKAQNTPLDKVFIKLIHSRGATSVNMVRIDVEPEKEFQARVKQYHKDLVDFEKDEENERKRNEIYAQESLNEAEKIISDNSLIGKIIGHDKYLKARIDSVNSYTLEIHTTILYKNDSWRRFKSNKVIWSHNNGHVWEAEDIENPGHGAQYLMYLDFETDNVGFDIDS